MLSAAGLHLDVELVAGVFLEGYPDPAFRKVLLSAGYGLRIYVPEHFQPVFGAPRQGTERDSYRKSGHAGPRDSHAHCVLEYVGAEPYRDTFGSLSQCLRSLCHAQRHGYRFRTAYGRHHLPLDEGEYLFAFGL